MHAGEERTNAKSLTLQDEGLRMRSVGFARGYNFEESVENYFGRILVPTRMAGINRSSLPRSAVAMEKLSVLGLIATPLTWVFTLLAFVLALLLVPGVAVIRLIRHGLVAPPARSFAQPRRASEPMWPMPMPMALALRRVPSDRLRRHRRSPLRRPAVSAPYRLGQAATHRTLNANREEGLSLTEDDDA